MNTPFRNFLPVLVMLSFFMLASVYIQDTSGDIEVKDKKELGRLLFFEKALSLDSSISCASCHIPEFAFADTVPFSTGVFGRKGLRNTPSVMNVAGRDRLFFDGRAADLHDQVHFPVEDTNEMALPFDMLVKRLNADDKYRKYFTELYGGPPNRNHIADAIAAFEMSLETANTPFDDYMNGRDSDFDSAAIRGRLLFLSDRTGCFDCHFGPDFTGDEFRNIGLFDGTDRKDAGRFAITGDSADLGRFKVPGLRNVGVTAPYMHDGSFKTLEEVLEYYTDPLKFVPKPVNIDPDLRLIISLSDQEKSDLLAFLRSLTDRKFVNR